MALDTKQIANLNALNQRIAGGYKPTETDTANLNYAKSKGYQYNPLPQGATKISDPNYLKTAGLTEKDIFRSGQDIYKLPEVPNQMTTEEMSSSPIIPENITSNQDSIVNSAMAGVDTSIKGLENIIKESAKPTEAEKQISPTLARINELEGKMESKPQDFQTELDKYGFQGNVKQLQELNLQMASAKAEYDKIANEIANKPVSSRIIGGTLDRLQRSAAINLGGLASMSEALQGNVNMAMDIASKTIDIKYEPVLSQIENQKFQLDQIYSQLDREEKRRADVLNLALQERERLIGEEKEKEMNISNVMLAAAQKGADQETLQKIMKATSYTDAIRLASSYLDETESGWTESDVTDANGNPMLFNTVTGEYKTSVGTSTSDIFFTDANGDSWNIAGWATDQTKPQQMNAIAKRIGKVTDDNINEKVKEFTPALTADMIKEASAQSGVSWEAIMTMVVQESLGGTSNVAKANNNFGGLTFNNQEWIKPFGGVKGTERPSAEGGNYIKFPTKQAGLNAMANLMAQYGKITPSEPVNTSAQNWADMIAGGRADLANVPAEERTAVVNALALTPSVKDTTDDLVAKQKAQQATSLMNHSGLNNAVGTIRLGRYAPFQWGQKQDFIASVEQLVSGLSLEALIEAKSRGATFGALSDREMGILAASATKIGTWTMRDKDGRVTGYKARESDFKAELQNISNILKRGLKDNTINQLDNNTMTSTPITGKTSSGVGYQVIE